MIYVKPGESRNFTVDGAPPGLAGQVGWRVENEADATIVPRSTTGTTEFATGAYRKALTAPTTKGRYVVVADFPTGIEVTIGIEVTHNLPAGVAGASFATAAEVATRLARTFTDTENDQADAALAAIANLIREAAGKPADWQPDPVPSLFKTLSIEKAVGVITNPTGVAAESERLGEHQHSRTFRRSMDAGIFLTDGEERLVREAVWGSGSGSSEVESTIDRVYEQRYGT